MTHEDNSKTKLELLALGEALVDLISATEASSLEDATTLERYQGGQPANLAANMALLGNRAAIAACIGEDGFGRYLFSHFEAGNVSTDFIQFTSQAPTSMAFITRNVGTADFMIARGADAFLQTTPALEEAAANSHVVHTSAFGLSREPARSTILGALRIAHKAGGLVSLDPNYHPKIWPDIADFHSMLESAYQFVAATKPSLDDCRRLFGGDHEPTTYARMFLDWGCRIVVLTLGAQGNLLASSAGEMVLFKGNPIAVADATGAGDAFWAGFLTALLDSSSPIEAAQMGQVLAEIKLRTVGPLKHLPSRDELLQRAASIQFREL